MHHFLVRKTSGVCNQEHLLSGIPSQRILKDKLDTSCPKDARGKAIEQRLISSEVQATTVGVSIALISNVVHLELTTCVFSIWSHLVQQNHMKSPAFSQVFAFREMPETSSQALNPCDGYRQHTCQTLLSSVVPNGSNMFQYVPLNYLPRMPFFCRNRGFTDSPWRHL